MKKTITSFALFISGITFLTPVIAQEKVKDKKTEEIVIRMKGDNDKELDIKVKGDKITVNGKPLAEFKDDNVTVKKGTIIITGRDNMAFDFENPNSISRIDVLKDWQKGQTNTSKAFLGVTLVKVENGVKIIAIIEGGAAEKAGLKKDDIITKIDDDKIEGQSSFSETIASRKPKDEIKVYYTRDGKEKSAKVTLGETKTSSMSFAFRSPNGNIQSFAFPKVPGVPPMPPGDVWEGQEFRDLKRGGLEGLESIGDIFGRRQKLGLKIQDIEEGNGIKVLATEKDSPAEKAGLQKDDVITEIAGKKIENTDDAREQLQEAQDKSSYTIKAKRNGTDMNFEVKIPKKLKTANL